MSTARKKELSRLSIKELVTLCRQQGVPTKGCTKKQLVQKLLQRIEDKIAKSGAAKTQRNNVENQQDQESKTQNDIPNSTEIDTQNPENKDEDSKLELVLVRLPVLRTFGSLSLL